MRAMNLKLLLMKATRTLLIKQTPLFNYFILTRLFAVQRLLMLIKKAKLIEISEEEVIAEGLIKKAASN